MLNKIFGKSGLPIKWHIEKRKLADLKRWDRNPRIIKGKPYEDLKKSIGKFGLAEPLVIQPSGLIIGGHARYEAMLDAKIEECDCYVPDKKLSDKEVEELSIRLNKNIAGSWDYEALANSFEVSDLLEYGFEDVELGLDVYGGSSEGHTDPDATPEPPKDPKTKTGDLYILGEHRLLCGDATKKEDIKRLMNKQRADMVFADPPYGINAEKMTMGSGQKDFHRGQWDSKKLNITFLLNLADKICVWGGNYYSDIFPITNDWLCWHKKNDGLSFSEFELAWTNFGKNCRHISHHWGNEKKQHVTMKPVEVCIWAINHGGDNNNLILDPFIGSGSTLIACEKTGRRCFGLEISPVYCDVIVQRFEAYTNKKAILERM